MDQVCLITDDGTETVFALVKNLRDQGWKKVVILGFPQNIVSTTQKPPADTTRVVLKDFSESCLRETLQTIQQDHGNIGSFIHLHPIHKSDSRNTGLFIAPEKAILKLVYFIAKHLKKSLNQSTLTSRNSFIIVTRLNGNLGFGTSKGSNPIAGGLFGLLKTVNIEWDPVFCRAIDICPKIASSKAVDIITAELYDPDRRLLEVGYSESGRVTLEADTEKIETTTTGTPDIDTSSVFLVSGGAKGVTAACVIELAKRYQSRFILLGRSELPQSEPKWAKDCFDDKELKKRCMEDMIARGEKPTPVKIMGLLKPMLAGREIKETLRAIKEKGGQVEYLSADINDSKNLGRKLEAVIKKYGNVTGIIHGAGVLADKLIEDKTEQDFEAVYSTKIDGLNSLLDCVKPDQLKHLVLFSSAAGFYGNEAQSDYAAANEILNKFSQLFKQKHPSCHVIAFNWGPWDGGMVTPELKKLFKERNIDVIPVNIGSRIMADELVSDNHRISQLVIGSSMIIPSKLAKELKAFQIQRKLELAENTFLKDHIIGGEPVLPIICSISWMADCCEQLYPGYRFFSCESAQVLKGIVFNKTTSSDFFLDIAEKQKSELDGITFEVKVSSRNPKGNPVFHYSAVIKLRKDKPECVSYDRFDETESDPLEGDQFYQDGTLFHGPIFQVLRKRVNIDSKKLTLQCQAVEISEEHQGQFPVKSFNYFADDGQLQALLVWVRHFYDAGSLPLKIQKGEFYSKIPFGEPYYISLEVISDSNSKLVADIVAHNENGDVFSRIFGAEAAISKNLTNKFQR
ncbi:SDR family NAD(P)-dependent oxidoreductase [bacterium]|nr:SDR family NAD(P)-dependent oxidoreductase [bacterium]